MAKEISRLKEEAAMQKQAMMRYLICRLRKLYNFFSVILNLSQ